MSALPHGAARLHLRQRGGAAPPHGGAPHRSLSGWPRHGDPRYGTPLSRQDEAPLVRGRTVTEGERVLRAPLRRLRRAPPRPLRQFSALLWSVAEPGREPRRHRSPHAASPRPPRTAGPGGSPWGIRHVPCPHAHGAFPGAGVASASWRLSAGHPHSSGAGPGEAGALLGRERPQTPGGGGVALGPGPGKGSSDLEERQGWPRSWETAVESTSELQKCAVFAGKTACLQNLPLSNWFCKCLYWTLKTLCYQTCAFSQINLPGDAYNDPTENRHRIAELELSQMLSHKSQDRHRGLPAKAHQNCMKRDVCIK
ncbi:translation initiation factor IF-2-like [Cygnus atratus]|uniref:translation initiation factor IF-2-like n=1 Tax=Cygnus atratus TaxID=8868 RepID=UPI0021B84D2E|nr:translation initiation factor IF-2-like [Cygnus atratus]